MRYRDILFSLITIYTFLIFPLLRVKTSHAMEQKADKIDIIAPAIIHNPPKKTIYTGDTITIKATITDNGSIEKVILYFRNEGDDTYKAIDMSYQDGNEYIADIPGDTIRLPSVEYYIEAIDNADNRTSVGLSSTPLVIFVTKRPPVKVKPIEPDIAGRDQPLTQNSKPETRNPKPWYKKWWVWTIAGAVVTGATIAAGSREGDSSEPTTGSGQVSW